MHQSKRIGRCDVNTLLGAFTCHLLVVSPRVASTVILRHLFMFTAALLHSICLAILIIGVRDGGQGEGERQLTPQIQADRGLRHLFGQNTTHLFD